MRNKYTEICIKSYKKMWKLSTSYEHKHMFIAYIIVFWHYLFGLFTYNEVSSSFFFDFFFKFFFLNLKCFSVIYILVYKQIDYRDSSFNYIGLWSYK